MTDAGMAIIVCDRLAHIHLDTSALISMETEANIMFGIRAKICNPQALEKGSNMKFVQSFLIMISLASGLMALNGCAAAPAMATNTGVRRRLAQPVLANFKKTPFRKAVATLAKDAGVNICIQRNALANMGILPSTPVTMHFLQPVPIKVALDDVLKTVESPESPLAWTLRNGVILISSRNPNSVLHVTYVYHVGSLIKAGGGASATKTRRAAMKNLAELIENTIDRTSWIDNGGTVGSLRFFHTTLVVTTTVRDQEAIAKLLAELAHTGKSRTP